MINNKILNNFYLYLLNNMIKILFYLQDKIIKLYLLDYII